MNQRLWQIVTGYEVVEAVYHIVRGVLGGL